MASPRSSTRVVGTLDRFRPIPLSGGSGRIFLFRTICLSATDCSMTQRKYRRIDGVHASAANNCLDRSDGCRSGKSMNTEITDKQELEYRCA